MIRGRASPVGLCAAGAILSTNHTNHTNSPLRPARRLPDDALFVWFVDSLNRR
ncbi:MAG: hypothetical protein JWQ46_930 [Phenylobacterium sp.]|nr:hypothetical protein [Phenylobacterium sp.]